MIWPDPRLREKALPVEKVDDACRQLVEDMFETMYAADGVGLAAPQIGVLQRVVVLDTSPIDESTRPFAMINPEILHSEGQIRWQEGCLSIPGEAEEVLRAAKVRVRFLDLEGRQQELEAEGILAVAIQHECDHLNGVVFVDYLSSLKRERIRKRMRNLQRQRAAEATV